MVNRANLKGNRAVYVYIRAGDFLQNGIQQGNHVHVAVINVIACVAINCRGINNREIKLLVACTQLNHQVEYLVDSSIGVSIGAVDLVDHNNDAQTTLKGMRKNETGLRLGAFISINNEQCAICHVENALHLATKVGMTGGVDNVDLSVLVMDGDVLRENGNAALALLIIRVEYAFGDFLVFAEYMRGPEQAVNQGGFTMVNVRNDCHIADVFLFHLLLPS